MDQFNSKNKMYDVMSKFNFSPIPIEVQRTLGFKVLSPEEKQTKEEEYKEEAEAFKKDVQEKDANTKRLAETWGLPWPQLPRPGPSRRGGPIPRAQKWEDGLYEYLEKVAAGL